MSSLNRNELNVRHVRSHFDRAATGFAKADFMHRVVANGLFERMQPMTLSPRLIVDLGSACGAASKRLALQYRKARILSVDLSAEMLKTSRKKQRWFSRVSELQADAGKLPLATGSADLIFANLLLPWINYPPAVFEEVARVLCVDGVFMFSTLGPDSLAEIRAAWSAIDDGLHVHPFPDMHNLGDAVMRAGLSDPVLDVDSQCVTYEDTASLFAEMAAAGARNSLRDRRHTLTGKNRMERFCRRLRGGAGERSVSLNLELVYGHAFGKGPSLPQGDFLLAPEDIGRRRI